MIIPYKPEKIARDTKYFNIDTVIVALELFKQLHLIYIDDRNCLKIAGFENMVGSETTWAKQKREQREKQKLLVGHCPSNVQQEIDKESDLELEKDIEFNGLNDRFNYIDLQLKARNLVQEDTLGYDELFKRKRIYIQNKEYMPENLITQIKLYQLAIKRLYDNKQAELLDKVTLPILEKVFGNILKSKTIENIIEYYISNLINELTK